MKIGFAQVDITPPLGTLMCGQLFNYHTKGVESNLFATAMCLDDNGSKVVFVSCDIVVLSNEITAELRQEAEKTSGVCADNVIICTTHTHSGPITQTLFGMDADMGYIADVKANIVRAIKEASENCVAGYMRIAKGELPGYAFNRRFIMTDGTVETHPLKCDPHIVCAEGPDSKDLTVLYAVDSTEKPIGAAVIFGCHATVMHRNNELISSDYCGKTADFVSDKLGDVPVVFLQGACGNICQTNTMDPSRREVGLDWVKTMGRAIGAGAISLIDEGTTETAGAVRVLTETIHIPRRHIDQELIDWAEKHEPINAEPPILSDYGTEMYGELEKPKVSLGQLFKTPFFADFYANEIKTLVKYCTEQPEMPFTIKVITADNWAIVALPCELFVEWSNEICERSPFAITSVVELANGWNGYIPTEEAFSRKGGYETKEVTSTMLVPQAGEMLTDKVLEMLKKAKDNS